MRGPHDLFDDCHDGGQSPELLVCDDPLLLLQGCDM
jgi:hypothetical protein